ncbi:hypothetical protein ROZALSC1DRAFT_28779, partial [Rozella allomycis CSF55]
LPEKCRVSLTDVITLIQLRCSSKMIVVGVDEVSLVASLNMTVFYNMYRTLGCILCKTDPFVVFVTAGTVIGKVFDSVARTSYFPLRIELEYLSLESSRKIVSNRLNAEMLQNLFVEQCLAEIGGHCRSLEIFCDIIANVCNEEAWNSILKKLIGALRNLYMSNLEKYSDLFERIITMSVLQKEVSPNNKVTPETNTTFQDIQESGL